MQLAFSFTGVTPNACTVYTDEQHQIWYQPADLTKPPQLLQDADSLCGVGIFSTGPNDTFRLACGVHDNFYTNRAWWEMMGWDRERCDEYFYHLCLTAAGTNEELIRRAHEYYLTVRMLGWIFWERHPAYDPKNPPPLPNPAYS